MKNRYMLIILTSIVLGILIGIVIKDYRISHSLYIAKDKLTKMQIKSTDKSIKELKKEVSKLYSDLDNLKETHIDTQQEEMLESLKENLSYTDISSKGMYICIDAKDEKTGNIANIIDYNKVLVNIVNEIKENGGIHIAINEERINQYTEIVLAGNHININSTPVAPPYNIKVIGDMDKLSKYIKDESEYLKSIQLNYPIKVDVKFKESITMKKMNLPNKLKYIEGDEN
ncbi:MAG: DUF881 domain-containing protein [Peptostreptococcaceae bacterium]